jgi:hypothetical protein
MSASAQSTDQGDRDLELLDSVMGSTTACANISAKLSTLKKTTAGCLSGPLSLLIDDFSSMSQSYTSARTYLKHRKPVWGQNVSFSIEFTQDRCQQIATELPTILRQYGEWDVLAAAGSCRCLNMLSKSFKVLLAHHSVLFRILDHISILARKPAEHEPPESIVIPKQWDHRYEELRARAYAADERARQMIKWSKDCASSFDLVQKAICLAKRRLKKLLDYQVAKIVFREQVLQPCTWEDHSIMDDWSTTQSTTGIMTPIEDWSDMGSETTEIAHTPAITRHSLQLCGYATANFLRLMDDIQSSVNAKTTIPVDAVDVRRLHKAFDKSIVHLLHALNAPVPSQSHMFQISSVSSVTNRTLSPCIQETKRFLYKNNIIEESFGHLPGSTPVGAADIEAMHKAYSDLVDTLLFNLATPIPFQNGRFASTPAPASPGPISVSNPVPVSEILRPVTPEVQRYSDQLLPRSRATPTSTRTLKPSSTAWSPHQPRRTS